MLYPVAFLYLSLGATASAQTALQPQEPGRLGERFQPPAIPRSTPPIAFPDYNAPAAPEGATAARFTLTGVLVDGGTVFAPSSFQPLYKPLVGQEITIADVYRLRDAITAKYRAAGYILSQAIVPPQAIQAGVVHIRIVEGSIGRVSIEGAAKGDRRILAIANHVKGSSPLTARDLERTALLINDLPGISASTVLKPSDTAGQADLVVTTFRKVVEGFASIDNRGSRAIGPFEAAAGVSFNSLLGLDEQLSLLVATASPTRELHYISGQYQQPIGSNGLRLTLNGSYGRSRPGGALAALDPLGTGSVAAVALDYPVMRSRPQTLRLGAMFTLQSSRTDLLSTKFSDDRVRFFTARANYDWGDVALGAGRPASSLLRIEINQGASIFGSRPTGSANLSRVNGHSDFTLVYGEITRVQRLGGPFSISISSSGQYAFVPLLSSQQFGLGGKRFGRGYEPSELTGDNGVAASIESRIDLPIREGAAAQLYAFYDAGTVWQKHPLPGQASVSALTSAGAGIRLSLLGHVNVAFEVAKPLTRDIASRGNRAVRPLFDVSVSF